jgi:hypothetical protein
LRQLPQPFLIEVRAGQKVVKRQQPTEDEAGSTIQEAKTEHIRIDKTHERSARQSKVELLEPPLEPFSGPDRGRDWLAEEPFVLLGFPDGVAVVLLDPGVDRRIRVVVEHLCQPTDPTIKLDMLMRLIVTGG